MTRKHFIAIAKIIRESNNKREITEKLISYLSTTHPNFDRDQFKEAANGYY